MSKNILTERSYHYCKANLFTDTIAGLYVSEDPVNQDKLFQSKYLEVSKKMSKIEAHIKVQRFCKYVLKQNVGLIDRKKLFPTMLLQDKIKEKIENGGSSPNDQLNES